MLIGSQPSDLSLLVARCLAGDQTSMLALVEHFRGQVFGLCYRMLGQREDAEDAAQETFVRVLKNLHRWDQTRDFEPWLLAIAGNRCRTALSVRKRRPTLEILPEQVCDLHPPEDSAKQLEEELTRALTHVRDDYRQAFVLFHQQQLSYDQIAEALQVPLGTVKTWVHRARKEIVEQLQRRGMVAEKWAVVKSSGRRDGERR